MKGNFEYKKNSKVKKNPSIFATNYNGSNIGLSNQSGQSGQTLSLFKKKDKHYSQQNQLFNIPAIGINTTIIKKDKKQDEKNLSQVKYYNCHKKNYCTNKYSNKKPKSNVSLGNFCIGN